MGGWDGCKSIVTRPVIWGPKGPVTCRSLGGNPGFPYLELWVPILNTKALIMTHLILRYLSFEVHDATAIYREGETKQMCHY